MRKARDGRAKIESASLYQKQRASFRKENTLHVP